MHVVTGLSFHMQLPEMKIKRKILGSNVFFGITNDGEEVNIADG